MNHPKISIVTPTFNQAEFLERTIISVLEQDYPNFEYIIIDGSSTDGTVDMIKKYSDRLAYWISEPDKSMYEAIQKGFNNSTGDIMMWINSDDLLHKGALTNIADIFLKFPSIEWITGINTFFDEKDRVINAFPAYKFSKYDFLLKQYMWVQQESTIWRRSLWQKAGSHIQINAKYAGDLELWTRFFLLAELYPCNILIGGFRMRSTNQLSLHLDLYFREANSFIAVMRDNIDFNTKVKLHFLVVILTLKKVLKYSVLLDLRITEKVLDRMVNSIKKYPTRIVIDRYTNEFTHIKY